MENKRVLKRLLISQLKENVANEKLIAILEGAPLQGELSEGELMLLTMTLPKKRSKEFLPYDQLPFWGWYELYVRGNYTSLSRDPFFQKAKNKANGFTEKMTIISCMDDISDTDFQEVLDLIQNEDQCLLLDKCLLLLDGTYEKNQTMACLEKLATLNPSIEHWCQVEEMASSFDYAQYVRAFAIKEMKTIAEKNNDIASWIKMYIHVLNKSENEQFIRQKINEFPMSFEDWKEIYEEATHYRVIKLALEKMQELGGSCSDWVEMMDNYKSVLDNMPEKTFEILCLSMIEKTKGTQQEYYDGFYNLVEDESKVIILMKMIQ